MSVSTNDLKNGMTLELDGTLFQVDRVPAREAGQGRRVRADEAAQREDRRRRSSARSTPASRSAWRSSSARTCSTSTPTATTSSSWTSRPTTRSTSRARSWATRAEYLVEGGQAQVAMHEGVPIAVDLPASMVLTITETDPGVKGDTRTGALKPATLETGRGRPGAAVRRGGREGQGRHAHRASTSSA